MKKLFFLLFLIPLISTSQTTPTVKVNTIADLRAVSIPTVNNSLSALVTGQSSTNGGIGGIFYYNASDTRTDNGVSIIKPIASNGRWIRPDGATIDSLIYGLSSTGIVVNAITGFTNASLTLSGGPTNNSTITLTGGPTTGSGYIIMQANGGDNVANVRQLAAAVQGQSAIAYQDVNGLERAAIGYGNLRGANTFNQLAYVEIGELGTAWRANPTDFAVILTHDSDPAQPWTGSLQYAPFRVGADGTIAFRRDTDVVSASVTAAGVWSFANPIGIGTLTGVLKGTSGTVSALTSVTGNVAYWSDSNTIGGNSQFYWDNPNASLLLGSSNSYLRLNQRIGTANSGGTYGGVSLTTFSSGGLCPLFDLQVSKNNTMGTQTIVADTDLLGVFTGRGSDGSAFKDAASIRFSVDGAPAGGSVPGAFTIWTTPVGSGSPLQRVMVNNAGYVGIGMTPTKQLELSTDSAQKPTTATWTVTSDVRAKDDIQPYPRGIAEIRQIEPKVFTYNGFGNTTIGQRGVGVIADEIEKVLPESVTITTNASVPYKTFNGHELIFGVMLNAIKQLDAENQALKTRIEALEKR